MTHHHPAVLIVEDQPDLRDLWRFYLNRKGYSVDTAGDGREALDKLSHGCAPCVILLDLMMPVMDGSEFREEQLRHPELAHIPVIACSGTHDIETIAERMGAKAHIRKPADLKDLYAVVQQHCLK